MAMGIYLFGANARADDKLLEETVEFTGTVLFLQSRVPALVIGVVRNGKTAVFGFGEASDGSGKPPDRHSPRAEKDVPVVHYADADTLQHDARQGGRR